MKDETAQALRSRRRGQPGPARPDSSSNTKGFSLFSHLEQERRHLRLAILHGVHQRRLAVGILGSEAGVGGTWKVRQAASRRGVARRHACVWRRSTHGTARQGRSRTHRLVEEVRLAAQVCERLEVAGGGGKVRLEVGAHVRLLLLRQLLGLLGLKGAAGGGEGRSWGTVAATRAASGLWLVERTSSTCLA